MIRKTKLAAVALSAVMLGAAAAGSAQAACTQDDLTGTWQLHGFAYDGFASNTVECYIKVKDTGRIAAGPRCFTTSVDNQGLVETDEATIAPGRSLKAKSNCKVVGAVKLDIDRPQNLQGQDGQLTGTSIAVIDSAQLSQDKNIVTGIALESFDGEFTIDQVPEPQALTSKSVIYFTLNKIEP